MVMRRLPRPVSAPRGYVLLATLAIVAVLSAVCASIAMALESATMARRLDATHRLADDLLLGTDRLIEAWLARHSRSVVLPPGAIEPRAVVYEGELNIATETCGIRITVRDVMGEDPRTTGQSATLNLNTASAPLLREPFRAAGRDDVRHVLTARSKGRPAPIVGSLSLPGTPAPVRLVGSSEAWTTTTEITVHRLTVRWRARFELEHGRWALKWRRRLAE